MYMTAKGWYCLFTFSVVFFYEVQLELSLILVLEHQDFFLVLVMEMPPFCVAAVNGWRWDRLLDRQFIKSLLAIF